MAKFATKDACAPATLTNPECRALRLRQERAVLAHRLEAVLAGRPDVVRFQFNGLRLCTAYAALEREGLTHATVVHATGCITILAATKRVMRKPALRTRLFALRRAAEASGQRVVIATSRGLQNEIARLRTGRRRAKRNSDDGAVPASPDQPRRPAAADRQHAAQG